MLTSIQCNFDFSICITFSCFVCHVFRWSCVIYAHAQSIEHDKCLKGGVSRDRNQQLSSVSSSWSLSIYLLSNALEIVVILDLAGRHSSVLRPSESVVRSCGRSRAGISPAIRATRCDKPLCQV